MHRRFKMNKEKIKVKIKEPVVCERCTECGHMDYIIGFGCKNCDLEVISY